MTSFIQISVTMLFASIVSLFGACTSTPKDDGAMSVKAEKVTLVSKDTGAIVKEFDDADNLSVLMAAIEKRERRYEKLLPLFEYRLNVTSNGEVQTWLVNKAGYLRKSDSPELYKTDVSAFFE